MSAASREMAGSTLSLTVMVAVAVLVAVVVGHRQGHRVGAYMAAVEVRLAQREISDTTGVGRTIVHLLGCDASCTGGVQLNRQILRREGIRRHRVVNRRCPSRRTPGSR